MKIGSSSKNIEYHENKLLVGFAAVRPCDGIISECKVRSLVLKGDENFALIQIDTVAIDDYFYNLVIERLEYEGFKQENIIISATHTHSSYGGLTKTKGTVLEGLENVFDEFDERYCGEILESVIHTIDDALSDLQDFKVKVAKGTLPNVGKERHDASFEGDEHLFCLEFIQANNEKILLYNFSCHPTVLHQDNFKLSADLASEQHFHGFKDVFFINGSAGNISTRFTRKVSDENEILRFGEMIQKGVEDLLKNSEETVLDKIHIKQIKIPMKVKQCDKLEVAELKVKDAINHLQKYDGNDVNHRRVLESYVEGAQANYLLSQNLKNRSEIIFNVSIIKSELFEIVTIPCEIFSTLTKSLRDKGIIIFGYTNGYYLYLVDKSSILRGDYEAMSSVFKEGEGERLIDVIENQLTIV